MIPDYSDPASFIDPGTSEEIALDWAQDALRFNTLGSNALRQGITVLIALVPVKLDASGKPTLVNPAAQRI